MIIANIIFDNLIVAALATIGSIGTYILVGCKSPITCKYSTLVSIHSSQYMWINM